MPYKFNASRRHKIPKARYCVTNWPEYDAALVRRGDLMVCFIEEVGGIARPCHRRARRSAGLFVACERNGSCPPSPQNWRVTMSAMFSLLPELLDQTDPDVASLTAEGANDGEFAYSAVAERHPAGRG